MSQGYTKGTPIDTDVTMSLNSDIVVPSQKAVKTYVSTNYQPTLVSGINIKTINGTSVLGSGDITISGGGGITVGTTPVTSGTDTRVFFQQGGVVQQDANFIFNNTQKRLTLRASGTASTDVPFVVRNSADSANLATIQGDGAATFGTYTNPNTRLTATGTTLGAYISGNTGIYAQSNTTTGTLYAIDCLGRALSGANTSYGIRAISDTSGVGSVNYAGRFQASGNATNYAGYFDAVNGTSNYALYIQRGWVQGTTGINILAQGALGTDLAFRVRNSANSADILTVQGDAIVHAKTRMHCGTSGMTTTGGALHVYAGNSADHVARFYGTTGNSFLNIRTAANGCQMDLFSSSGVAGLQLNGQYSNAITLAAGRNIVFDTVSGGKIGSATNEKIGFWNATPIVQPTTAVTAATLVSGAGTAITSTDTFDGYTLQQIVKALRNTGILA